MADNDDSNGDPVPQGAAPIGQGDPVPQGAASIGDPTPQGAAPIPPGVPSLIPQQAPNAPATAPGTRLPNEPSISQDVINNLPMIGGTAASIGAGLAFPELTIPAIIARAAIAGGGAGLGSVGKQALSGQTPTWSETWPEMATSAGGELVGLGTTKALGRIFNPQRLYQSALGQTGEEAEKATQAGLKNSIALGSNAAEKADALQKQIASEVQSVIDSSPKDIPPQQYTATIKSKLDGLRNIWGKDPAQGKLFQGRIDRVERNFLLENGNVKPITRTRMVYPDAGPPPQNIQDFAKWKAAQTPRLEPVTIQPRDMTLDELRANAQSLPASQAQQGKKSAWYIINSLKKSFWGADAPQSLNLDSRAALGEGLMSDLEKLYPELKGLNQNQGEAIALRQAAEDAAERNFKTSLQGYLKGTLFEAGATGVGALFGQPGKGAVVGAGTMLLRRVMNDPRVKSRLGIALYQASRAGKIPVVGPLIRSAAQSAPANAMRYLRIKEPPKHGEWIQPGQAKGGPVKSDYLDGIKRRSLNRSVVLKKLGARG
jgi:hypothetical protein